MTERDATLGIVVPTWNRAASVARCLAAIAREPHAAVLTVVVDNGSTASEHEALLATAAGYDRVEIVTLPVNRGFAGAVNVGLATVFARGVSGALLLNDDAELEVGAAGALLAYAATDPKAGIVAPRVLDAATGREVSRGERLWLPLVCVPRTWLRVRRADDRPYPVSGVLGVAFLVTRHCFAQVGPLTDDFFAYYEEVEYCLRVRAAGFRLVVVPSVAVRHEGFRGFAGGFTPLAAYLKARNLPLLVRRRGTPLAWLGFLPTYLAMVGASVGLYVLRGRAEIVRALVAGVGDGLRGRSGAPPAHVVVATTAAVARDRTTARAVS